MHVFSFCLYGTDPNYYTGLLENFATIQAWFPDFQMIVYKGICDPTWTLPEGIRVVETGKEGPINALYRYLPLATESVGFVRDADSRITDRDRWCINAFLASPYSYHIIRDHHWHKSKIMAGLFGWKKPLAVELPLDAQAVYGFDESVLETHVYPRVVSDALVHTNLYALVGEHAERIDHPMADPTDFLGNVIWNGTPKFTYVVDPIDYLLRAQGQDQFALMDFLADQIDPLAVPYDQRTPVYFAGFLANYYLRNYPKAQQWLRRFEFAEVSPHVYNNSNFLLTALGAKVIAAFDPNVVPGDNEVVVYYGNYPDWHLALPGSSRIYRHVSKFWDIQHDEIRYHPVWDPIDTIYVVNLDERVDRWYDSLLALAAVQAPLHRIHHYKANKDSAPAYVGATKNHVDVIANFCASGASRCLVLEDDFVFLDDRETVWNTLAAAWTTPVPYQILFLALSKTGKRSPVDADSALCKTEQACTTSSGYILQAQTAPAVLETVREGYQKIKETGHGMYCIDRYWTKLPHLYCTRPKLGFQRPSYSNLLRTVSAHLD